MPYESNKKKVGIEVIFQKLLIFDDSINFSLQKLIMFFNQFFRIFVSKNSICLVLRFICAGCEAFIVETRFHCTVCFDFHLCMGCYKSGKYQIWCVVFTFYIFFQSWKMSLNQYEKLTERKI